MRDAPDSVWHDRRIVAHRVQLLGRANCPPIDERRTSEPAAADRPVRHSELSLGAGRRDGDAERFPVLGRLAERSARKHVGTTEGHGDNCHCAAVRRVSSAAGPRGDFHSLGSQRKFDSPARGRSCDDQISSAPGREGRQIADRAYGLRCTCESTAAQFAERGGSKCVDSTVDTPEDRGNDNRCAATPGSDPGADRGRRLPLHCQREFDGPARDRLFHSLRSQCDLDGAARGQSGRRQRGSAPCR
jgi:hypothetical protein